MTATNHALTGALIGLIVGNPVIALPAALLSHIVCDALPHFGADSKDAIRSKGFARYLVVDASLCVLLVIILAITRPQNWQLAVVCAFVATAPDLLWIRWYKAALQKRKLIPNTLERFLAGIQWFEKPIGGLVEVVWLVGASAILWQFL